MESVNHAAAGQIDRQSIRRRILAARDALSPEDRRRKSMAVTENLWRLDRFVEAKTLFVYVDFRSEVQTLPLIRQCLSRGIRVAVPLTSSDSRLLAYRITDPDQDLRPGYCSIPEPDPDRLPVVDPAEIEVVILPGSVFDVRGGRLGYGGGCYDRFLANRAPAAVRIGLAYELQVVPQAPLLPHDQRLHYLISEERIIEI